MKKLLRWDVVHDEILLKGACIEILSTSIGHATNLYTFGSNWLWRWRSWKIYPFDTHVLARAYEISSWRELCNGCCPVVSHMLRLLTIMHLGFSNISTTKQWPAIKLQRQGTLIKPHEPTVRWLRDSIDPNYRMDTINLYWQTRNRH